ncbi:hypothetical protein NEIELOOT_02716 [Neisseria elongata subsp. glycolytica ATCC 29315]|uniref:Uncharacterized protein n=1 Tax=Neisseria elongata subsp. glycolytica ATCC 29315 TaxID=546263 RepID=D4DUF6_NEIEG|nr:hypothetical protein NEIELOOT_02716 [Neisseria elongata subsp. glycolytica ATCC 29315]
MIVRQKQPVCHPLDSALQRYGQGNQRQGLVFLIRDFQVAFRLGRTGGGLSLEAT